MVEGNLNTMSLYLGIDIASVDANKNIDWAAAYAAGCRFAIIRGSYVQWADPTWARERDRAEAAGMVTGAYLFPDMGITAPPPQQQVNVFFSALGKYGKGNLPATLDVEFPGGIKKTGKSRRELWLTILLFEHLMREKQNGVPGMIYTSQRVVDGTDEDALDAPHQQVDLRPLAECLLWEARYPYNYRLPAVGDDASEKQVVERLPKPPTASPWQDKRFPVTDSAVTIFQYQGDALGFPGFRQTDMNKFYDLRVGMTGTRVAWLQDRLGMVEGTVGVFDDVTETALEQYQKNNGLVADGVAGPRTFASVAWQNPPKF